MRSTALLLLSTLVLTGSGCPQDGQAPRRIEPGLSPVDLVLPLDPPATPQLPAGIPVRVMTFNLYGGSFASAEAIGAFIAGQDLDLVGLEECPADYLEPIAAAAGFAYYGGAGVALLSKTPLSGLESVSLRSGRSFVHAATEIGGRTFSVYVAHLGWNLDGDHQCREFVDEHLSLDPVRHLLLVGDFNDEHLSSQISILEEVVADAATVAGWYPGERISWPSTRFDDTEGSQLIDLVFFRRDFAPIVVALQVHNLSPVLSDHKPVVAELLYPPADQPFDQDPYAALRDPRRDWPDPLPGNLLTNPGAEEGLTGWQVDGDGQAVAERDNQSPFLGAGLFAGFEERPQPEVRWSAGSQEVDLSSQTAPIDASKCRLLASGQMATGFQTLEDDQHTSNMARPYDEAEVIVEALDGPAGRVLGRASSGRRDTLGWFPFAVSLDLPPASRTARLTWMSHHKVLNGPSNDGVFDDLHLALDCQAEPHPAVGPNLLGQPGAESDDLGEWEADGWQRLADLETIGLAVFPPSSRSGRGLWFAGGPLDLEPGPPGTSSLTQRIDLSAFLEAMDAGELALRWGGWLRTWAAESHVRIDLEILDGDGSPWGRVPGSDIQAAEWTRVEHLTRVPAGASAVVLVLQTEVEPLGTGAFADDLFVVPERVEAVLP